MVEWDGTVALQTPRLTLRTFRREDLPLYAALNRDPEVMEFLGPELSREGSDDIAEWANQVHAEEGIGLLAVERTADGTFLGMCGLHHLRWFPDDIEVGWRLARAHWGHGYATEAAQAWLRHGFTVMSLPRIISVTDAPNARSRAVMTRLGMTLDQELELIDDGTAFDAVVYAIAAEDWQIRSSDRVSSAHG